MIIPANPPNTPPAMAPAFVLVAESLLCEELIAPVGTVRVATRAAKVGTRVKYNSRSALSQVAGFLLVAPPFGLPPMIESTGVGTEY